MKILYLHRTQGKGVEGVHITEVADNLSKLGSQVDILSPHGINTPSDRKSKKDSFYGRILLTLSRSLPEFCFELMEIFYNFIGSRSAEGILRKGGYDLIFERYAIFNVFGVLLAKKLKIPIIMEINYTSYTPLYRKRSGFLKPLAHLFDKKIFSLADGFVVVSSYLRDHLIEKGVNREKIIVLTNAADPEKFNPNINGKKVRDKYKLGNRTVLGFVGGFYPWHGLELLVEAFGRLKSSNPDICLLLVGDGPQRETIEEKTVLMNIRKDVIFAGTIGHGHLAEYIAAFDIAVMPHSNDYGSPMKIFEYMAMAKPVVAPKLGPLQDGIENGKQGMLFAPKDPDALREALGHLINDPGLCERMGKAGRSSIIEKHTWKNNAQAIIKLYNKIRNI